MAVVPVRRPVAAEHQLGRIHRSPIEERDFFWMRRISEIEYRNTTLIPGLRHDVAPGNWNERAVVRDAVFLLGLSNGRLVVARRIQVVAAAIENRVGAPRHLVPRPTACS